MRALLLLFTDIGQDCLEKSKYILKVTKFKKRTAYYVLGEGEGGLQG